MNDNVNVNVKSVLLAHNAFPMDGTRHVVDMYLPYLSTDVG